MRLGLISATPYSPNVRIDSGIIFGFRRNLANDCKLQVRSGFWGVSLISVFSSYCINLSRTLCGRPPPPTPGPTAAAAAVALTVRAAPFLYYLILGANFLMFLTNLGPIWYAGLDSERRWHSQRICVFAISRFSDIWCVSV